MTLGEREQQTAARIAGALYLLTMATAMGGELFARGRVIASDAAETAANLASSERLFRAGIVSGLVTQAGDVALLWALYVILRPINRNLALLAAFWRLVECSSFMMIAFTDFAALRLLSGADYLRAFDTKQLQALARFFIGVHHLGGQIAIVFFALGSTLFAYLWFKSRYIPRALSAFGIFASVVVGLVTLVTMMSPGFESAVTPAYWVPIFIFEVVLGVWLLVKGVA